MTNYTKPATKDDIKGMFNWLSTKPANDTYFRGSPHNCLISQFLRACGYSQPYTGVSYVYVDNNTFQVPKEIAFIAYDSDFYEGGNDTYGAALFRAKQILQSMS